MMLAWIIGGGLGLLIGLAVVIGQRSAQEHAWSAVAAERRELHEMRVALGTLADDLAAEGRRLGAWESQLVLATENLRSADVDGGRP